MPNLALMNIPTPKSWEEFESICLSSFKIRWNSPNLVRYGRQGQAQQGVDIYGEDHNEKFVGIQCKKLDGTLTIKTVEEEIEKATQFEPAITSFYLATTAPPDAKIQKEIRVLSEQRKQENQFSVGIFFWEDIVQELITNKDVFKKHFPELALQEITAPKRTIALFDLAYWGLGFKINIDLILGEMSEDKSQLLRICTMIEGAARRIMAETELENLCSDLNFIKEQIELWLSGNVVTEEQVISIQNIGDQIVHKVNTVQYDLEPYDLATFTLATKIVIWDNLQNTGKPFDETPILEMLKIIFNNIPSDLLQLIDSCKIDDSVRLAQYPHQFFVLCKKHFIRMQLPD